MNMEVGPLGEPVPDQRLGGRNDDYTLLRDADTPYRRAREEPVLAEAGAGIQGWKGALVPPTLDSC